MATFMNVINHGTNQIDRAHIGSTSREARPVELHYKTNGSIKNQP